MLQVKPTVLLILDGFGHSENADGNAIMMAETPVWDALWKDCPHTLLDCSGPAVGLPEGQMGNSEVGHLHIGAGRLLAQTLTQINQSVADKTFYQNSVLKQAVTLAVDNGKALHILGLLSPGGVHSHEEQIQAMVKLAAQQGLEKIYLHAFLDGRDVPPKSAESSLLAMQALFAELGCGRIASITGRFYAMDRDKNWDRVESAYRAIVKGEAEFSAGDPVQALDMAYQREETDEFVQATLIVPEHEAPVITESGDVMVFMNFRADRAREIAQALTMDDFSGFRRGNKPQLGGFVTLSEYHEDFTFPVAFPPQRISDSLGEVIAKAGLKQLRLAETEKYAHVTFFFNGGVDTPFEGEDRILIPSPKVRTYDLKPEMSAVEVTDRLVEAIEGGEYAAIICNYANGDMVGHTGIMDAAVIAMQVLDQCLGRINSALARVGGQMLVTADHGNAEQMLDPETQGKYTAHTVNPVPLVYVGGTGGKLMEEGSLADIAPTLLAMMQLPQPEVMTGHSLLDRE